MKLRDAIQAAGRLVEDESLDSRDRVAVHVLVELAKRVQRAQKPLRQVHRAICPDEELNQTSLFGDD